MPAKALSGQHAPGRGVDRFTIQGRAEAKRPPLRQEKVLATPAGYGEVSS